MSFSSGVYFGSHSRVSQGRAASAFVVSLLVWIGPLSRTATSGRARSAVPYAAPIRSSRSTKSVERLVGLVCTSRPRRTGSKAPSMACFFAWAGGFDAQLGAAPGPAARQIGMRERLGFVEKHQIDRLCCRLGFQIAEVPRAGLDRGCVLAP